MLTRLPLLGFLSFFLATAFAHDFSIAQEKPRTSETQPDGEKSGNPIDESVRQMFQDYVAAFNQHKSEEVAAFWTNDGLSVDEETGERTQGRKAVAVEFSKLFELEPSIRLSGRIDQVRQVRPDVLMLEGRTTRFVDGQEPVEAMFRAVLVSDGKQWLISSSHESALPTSASSSEALQSLNWLVGRWQDESQEGSITTSFRWSANRAFLIRSFAADFSEADSFEGTQVIGWDPRNDQIRTWTFHSDGSFGEGTVVQDGDEWLLRMSQVLSDGRVASGTQVLTRVDESTFTIQTIGKTLDGEPLPSSDPVTVIRVSESSAEAGSTSTHGEEEGSR